MLIEGLGKQEFALPGFAVFGFYAVKSVDIFLLDELVQIFQLRLKALHLGEIRAVLAESFVIVLRGSLPLLGEALETRAVAKLGHLGDVASLGELEERFLAHALGLSVC